MYQANVGPAATAIRNYSERLFYLSALSLARYLADYNGDYNGILKSAKSRMYVCMPTI